MRKPFPSAEMQVTPSAADEQVTLLKVIDDPTGKIFTFLAPPFEPANGAGSPEQSTCGTPFLNRCERS